jgi:hypothetical protein
MLISEIYHWLNTPNRDYWIGVMLYDEHGSSSLLKGLFKKGNNLYNQEKIYQELNKLSTGAPLPVKEKPQPVKKEYEVSNDFAIQGKKKLPTIHRKDLPERLKELDIRKSTLHTQARYWKVLQDNLSEDEKHNHERANYAREIESNFNIIDHIWKEINHYMAKGEELPEAFRVNLKEKKKSEHDFSGLSDLEMHKKLASARSMLSRAKHIKGETQKYVKLIEAITNHLNNE